MVIFACFVQLAMQRDAKACCSTWCRYHTFQDERNLYMVMEYVPGGELYRKLRKDQTFDNELTRFYVAQLVMALQYMHSDNIIFRGLVPDNLLVDEMGYLKLCDFGYAKHLIYKEVRHIECTCGTTRCL